MVQILEERGWLFGTIFFTTLLPLLQVFGMGAVGSGQTREGIAYIITGSAVSALSGVGINIVAQELGRMKETGEFLYYAALPISKGSLLLALMTSKLLIQLPGVVTTLVGGSIIYGYDLNPNPLLLLILLLAALSLSGLGAALGVLSPSWQLTTVLSAMGAMIILFATPVMIPIGHLPLPLQWFGLMLPPTYAADALRRTVSSVLDVRLAFDFVVLFLSATGSILLLTRGLRWRLN